MNITSFQKITSILHKYEFKEYDGSMNAEHDEIHFGGPNERQVSCWHVFA